MAYGYISVDGKGGDFYGVARCVRGA